MERFLSRQNIELYRKLHDRFTDELQRRLIFKLLAEEQEKFRQSGRDPCRSEAPDKRAAEP
jgi:hypothetical protein